MRKIIPMELVDLVLGSRVKVIRDIRAGMLELINISSDTGLQRTIKEREVRSKKKIHFILKLRVFY